MKALAEYIQKKHVTNSIDMESLITAVQPYDNELTNTMRIRIPIRNSSVYYYIKYKDLKTINKSDFIEYVYTLYTKTIKSHKESNMNTPCICFQFFSEDYQDYVTGYYVYAKSTTHGLNNFIDNQKDNKKEYNQIQQYFEQ